MIKAIIFDWHGVLDRVKFEGLVQKLSEVSDLSKEDVRSKIHEFERRYAAGLIEPSVFWSQTKEVLGLDETALSLARDYMLSIDKNVGLWDILSTKLKNYYRLAILSDNPRDKVAKIRSEIDLSLFETVYFSCEKHLLKDSAEFFRSIVKKLELNPNECLYIDDSEKHISTAQELGFQVHLFVTNKDFSRWLNKF